MNYQDNLSYILCQCLQPFDIVLSFAVLQESHKGSQRSLLLCHRAAVHLSHHSKVLVHLSHHSKSLVHLSHHSKSLVHLSHHSKSLVHLSHHSKALVHLSYHSKGLVHLCHHSRAMHLISIQSHGHRVCPTVLNNHVEPCQLLQPMTSLAESLRYSLVSSKLSFAHKH